VISTGKGMGFFKGEMKRQAARSGFERDVLRQRRSMEKTFASARECVREYELRQELMQDHSEEAYELIEHIKAGGRPY
jgi:hypothetical protein